MDSLEQKKISKMKIEKGKLYLFNGHLKKADEDKEVSSISYSDKIAVHCFKDDDFEYLSNKLGLPDEYRMYFIYGENEFYIRLDNNKWVISNDVESGMLRDYKIISVEDYRMFYPEDIESSSEMITDELGRSSISTSVDVNKNHDISKESDFKTITDSISELLEYKNKKYGNAVLEPLQIFSGKCKAGTRLDDKLSRVKNSSELRKNDIVDLLGYLILTCKENGWTDFSEFKD